MSTCLHCGAELWARARSSFCGVACSQAYTAQKDDDGKVTKQCASCAASFVPYRKAQVCCTRQCYRKWWRWNKELHTEGRDRSVARTCVICTAVIPGAARSDMIYCSDGCRVSVYRDKPQYRSLSKEYQKERRQLFPEKIILAAAKSRAKKSSIPFNITLDDISIPEFCPVLGLRLQPGGGRNEGKFCGPSPSSPSLDRIKPELGYTKGNVRVISNRANTLKSNATLNELSLVLLDLQNLSTSTSY